MGCFVFVSMTIGSLTPMQKWAKILLLVISRLYFEGVPPHTICFCCLIWKMRLWHRRWGCVTCIWLRTIGFLRSQIKSEVQSGGNQKTQCLSNTNWTTVERRSSKLTMQSWGDWVNSTTQLVFKTDLKMIFCCPFATARVAPVAIFCPTAFNSDFWPPSSYSTARYRGGIFPRCSLRRDTDRLTS